MKKNKEKPYYSGKGNGKSLRTLLKSPKYRNYMI